jgi:hypothetical protein
MNPYLVRLRGRDHETLHPQAPSKPSKPILPVVADVNTTAERGFEGFEGDRSRCFSVEQIPLRSPLSHLRASSILLPGPCADRPLGRPSRTVAASLPNGGAKPALSWTLTSSGRAAAAPHDSR